MRPWLRRNAVGLVASLVGLVLVAGVLVAWPLSGVPHRTVLAEVPAGGTYTWKGREIRVVAAGVNRADGPMRVPKGTRLVAMLLRVHATSSAEKLKYGNCDVELVVPAPWGAEDRRWDSESAPSDYGYRTGDDSAVTCSMAEPEDFTLEQVYLAPTGTYDHAVLDMSLGLGPSAPVVRFRLPPARQF